MTKRTIVVSLVFLGICAAGIFLLLMNMARDVRTTVNDKADRGTLTANPNGGKANNKPQTEKEIVNNSKTNTSSEQENSKKLLGDNDILKNIPKNLADQWEPRKQSFEKLTEVKISDIPEPKEYSLRLDPKPGQRYRYIRITKTYSADLSNSKPGVWMCCDMGIEITRDENGQLLIEQHIEKPLALAAGSEMPAIVNPPPKQHFTARDGELYNINESDGNSAHVSETPATEADFVFVIPKDVQLKIGASWPFDRTNDAETKKGKYTLVGFSDVTGVRTAKFVSESESTITPAALSTMIEKTKSKSKLPIGADLSARLSSALSAPHKVKRTIYVEIGTGMSVRQEIESTFNNLNTTEILQRIPFDN
jgi:hypothetical protein